MQAHTGFLLFSIATSIIWSLWAGAVARERNRAMLPFMVLGAAFPVLGVVIAYLTPARRAPEWRA